MTRGGGWGVVSWSIRLHVVCAVVSSDNELKMTRNGEQIDLIKLLAFLLRASPTRLQWSVPLCPAVPLFPLWRPQVTGHRWNSDSIFKTWTNWLWFRCQGTLCVLGTSLFWKVPTWTCSNQPFFQHMLWENTPPALHNSLAPYTYTKSKESVREAQQLGSDIWIHSLNDVIYRPNLTEFRACWDSMLWKRTVWKEFNCLTQHWCYLFRKK